jgi:hypothetical protein
MGPEQRSSFGFSLRFGGSAHSGTREKDPGAKALAAVLGGLACVALTELGAFVAVMLKHSLDERNTALQRDAVGGLTTETTGASC